MIAGEIITKYIADVKDHTAGVQKVVKDIQQVEDAAKSTGGAMDFLKGAVSGAIGAFAGFAALRIVEKIVELGREVVALGDELEDLSTQTQISIRVLRGLQIEAEQVGTSLAAITTGINFVMRNLADGIELTGRQAAAFRKLGIDASDAEKLMSDPEGALLLLGQRMSQLESHAEKLDVAFRLAGRAGQTWVPVLDQIGKEGLPRVNEEAAKGYQRLGEWADAAKRAKAAAQDWLASLVGLLNFDWKSLADRMNQMGQRPGVPGGLKPLTPQQMVEDAINRLKALRESVSGPPPGEKPPSEFLGDLVDPKKWKEAADKAADIWKAFTKSITADIVSVQAKIIEFEKGKEAAEQFRAEQAAMAQLEVTALTPAAKALVAKYMEWWKIENDITETTERHKRINAELTKELDFEDKVLKKLIEDEKERVKLMVDQSNIALESARLEIQAMEERGEVQTRILDQIKGLRVDIMPRGIDKQIAEVTLGFERQRIELERLLVLYQDYPVLAGHIGEALDLLATKQQQALLDLSPTMRIFDTLSQSIESAIDQSVAGVIQGTQTLSDAMKNMARSIMLAFISELNKTMIIQPLMQFARAALSGFLSGGFGAAPAGVEGPLMQGGGFFSSPLGPLASAFETAGPAAAPLTEVNINGSVIPNAGVSPDQVVQIVHQDLDNRGVLMNTIEGRMSSRR